MKIKSIQSLAALSVVAALAIGIPTAAFGDPTTTTTVATKAPTAWTTWRASWIVYIHGLRAINATTAPRCAATAPRSGRPGPPRRPRLSARPPAPRWRPPWKRHSTPASRRHRGRQPAPPPNGFNGTTYILGFQAANIARRAAVAAAESAYATALVSATTSAQRRADRLTFIAAVDTADAARINALIALGTPPKHPGQP